GPELALSYSSGLGNGPFGLGWDIGLATIRRKTEKGLPRYLDGEESDVFILSGGEDLVPVLVREGDAWVREIIDDPEYTTYDGERYTVYRYRPRIEGLYARIERWVRRSDGDTHWRTIAPDNRATLYGRTPAARIADPSDGRKVFQWLVERSYDDRGNVVDYEYASEDAAGVDAALPQERNRLRTGGAFAQKYLKRILYGNTLPFLIHLNDAGGSGFDEEAWAAANRWHFQLVLDYGEHAEHDPTPHAVRPWPVRADPFSTYRAGFEIRTYRLCRRFLMFHDFESELGPGPRLVRSTDLAYDE